MDVPDSQAVRLKCNSFTVFTIGEVKPGPPCNTNSTALQANITSRLSPWQLAHTHTLQIPLHILKDSHFLSTKGLKLSYIRVCVYTV